MNKKQAGIRGSVSYWLRENASKHKTRAEIIDAALKEFPEQTRRNIGRRVCELPKFKTAPSAKKSQSHRASRRPAHSQKVPRSFRMAVKVDQVETEYDDDAKIVTGLEHLGDSIIKDNDFRVELGIAHDRWKVASNLSKHEKNKIELRGKQFRGIFWGQEDILVALRHKIDMT